MTTAIRMGAVCSAPTWVTNAASNTIEKGAATSDPGTAASKQVKVSPKGHAGNRLVHHYSGRSPDEQRGKDGSTHEAAGLTHRKSKHLRDHQHGDQPDAKGLRVAEHGLELVAACEQRQWEGNTDKPEHQAAKC